jgi:hypothetical protein
MASDRPYSGMSWDDMEKRLNNAERELIREIVLIDTELQYRSVPSARALHQRVHRLKEFFVRGAYVDPGSASSSAVR